MAFDYTDFLDPNTKFILDLFRRSQTNGGSVPNSFVTSPSSPQPEIPNRSSSRGSSLAGVVDYKKAKQSVSPDPRLPKPNLFKAILWSRLAGPGAYGQMYEQQVGEAVKALETTPGNPYYDAAQRKKAAEDANLALTQAQTESSKSATELAKSAEARNTENFRNLMDTRYAATLARANPFIDPFGGTTDNMSMDPRALMSLIATGKFRNPNEGYLADSTQVPPALSAYAGSLESGARAQTIEGNDLGAASLRSASIRPEDYLWSTTGGSTRDQIKAEQDRIRLGRDEIAARQKGDEEALLRARMGLLGSAVQYGTESGQPQNVRSIFANFLDLAGVSPLTYNSQTDPFATAATNMREAGTGAANVKAIEGQRARLEKAADHYSKILTSSASSDEDKEAARSFFKNYRAVIQSDFEPFMNIGLSDQTPPAVAVKAATSKPNPAPPTNRSTKKPKLDLSRYRPEPGSEALANQFPTGQWQTEGVPGSLFGATRNYVPATVDVPRPGPTAIRPTDTTPLDKLTPEQFSRLPLAVQRQILNRLGL